MLYIKIKFSASPRSSPLFLLSSDAFFLYIFSHFSFFHLPLTLS